MTPMRTATCVCGGEIVATIYGFGHVTNPGFKHHRPTPRSAHASSSRAHFGVPDISRASDRQLNTERKPGTPPSTPARSAVEPRPSPRSKAPALRGAVDPL